MVAQYTVLADVIASPRAPVANSKGQSRAASSATSFDQHLKEQTKAADARTARNAGNGETVRDNTRARTETDRGAQAAPESEVANVANTETSDQSDETANDVSEAVSTHSEIILQFDQPVANGNPAPANSDMTLPAQTEDGAGDEMAQLPATPPIMPTVPTDAAADDGTTGATSQGSVPTPANGNDTGQQSNAPVAPELPAGLKPDGTVPPATTDETGLSGAAQDAGTQENTTIENEDATTRTAATPPAPLLDENGQQVDAEAPVETSKGSPGAPAAPSPDLSTQSSQTAQPVDVAVVDGNDATVAPDAAPKSEAANIKADASVKTTDTPAPLPASGEESVNVDADATTQDKPAETRSDAAEAQPKKPVPVALTLPEQQPTTPAQTVTSDTGTIVSAKTETPAANGEQVVAARPETAAPKDKQSQASNASTDASQSAAANAVNAGSKSDADGVVQTEAKDETKAARPDQPAAKAAAKSADASAQQQAASSNADVKTDQRPANTQAQSDEPATDADTTRASRSDTAVTEEPKQAAKQAPKGEAFAKLMARLEGSSGLKDMAMQSDQTLRVDTATSMQTDASSVRLTGMEQMARTGQMPTHASIANAQAIAAQISRFATKGETRFEIRLDPADLGKVDVRLTIGSDGQARAHLFVEKSETMDFLMRDQRFLERSLQQSGINVDKQSIEYSLMDQQGQQQQMTGQRDHQQFEQDRIANNRQMEEEQLPAPSILEPNQSGTYMASNGINLVI
ncbi:flagellar hook-length control protein FliK [uncultured Cohaesibacter sp.]|uniref:flagellar hook-length control protein FliK n=1 Tax=uncultured Cohaesibacter sp. TaxID=1002546 RepID=UPI0029C7A808|nr:flagellar hook-length control protein FliK [uncultured Cohaesibacter sp.]